MDVPRPEQVALTPEERALLERIDFDGTGFPEPEVVRASGAAAAELTHSLLDRGAIPEIRLRYVTDPELNIGGHGKSRAEVFERNGCVGEAMLQHPSLLAVPQVLHLRPGSSDADHSRPQEDRG